MIVWPVYAYIALQLIGFGVGLAKHGEYVKLNVWSSLFIYIDKVRNIVMNFFKGIMKENKDSKEDILKFVYKIIEIDTDNIIMNKDED